MYMFGPKVEKSAIKRLELRTIILNNIGDKTLSPEKLTSLENEIFQMFGKR